MRLTSLLAGLICLAGAVAFPPATHGRPIVLFTPVTLDSLAARFGRTQVTVESEEDALCLEATVVPFPPDHTLYVVNRFTPAKIIATGRDTTLGSRRIWVHPVCPKDTYLLHTHSELHARWIAPEDPTGDWYKYPSMGDYFKALREHTPMAIVQWAPRGFTAYSSNSFPMSASDGQR